MSRSRSPFGFRSSDPSRRDPYPETSDEEDSQSQVVPLNNFINSSDSESDDEEELDEELLNNTEQNALFTTEFSEEPEIFGEGQNFNEIPVTSNNGSGLRRRNTRTKTLAPIALGRPVFEKNRVRVTVSRGEVDGTIDGNSRQPKSYLCCSDFSKESTYALEWAVGTIMREGDSLRLIHILETDSKFDSPSDKAHTAENQKIRRVHALLLAKQVTTLLERTRINIKIHCVAIHSKVLRHSLLDMIDFFEPTLVIIGSRGLSSIKGMLLGSLSAYLIQKSSIPVMVCRRPLRIAKPASKIHLDSTRVHRSLANAEIEMVSKGGEKVDDPAEADDIKEKVAALTIGE